MTGRRLWGFVVVSSVALVLAQAGLLVAQEVAPEEYGLAGTNYTFISGEEFIPGSGYSDSCNWETTGVYHFWFNSGSADCLLYAPVDLPAGALMTRFMVLYNDSSPIYEVQVGFYRFWMDITDGMVGSSAIGDTFVSAGEPNNAVGIIEIDPNETYSVVVGTSQVQSYVVRAYMRALTNQTALRGVIVQWKRQISPAPAIQTFPDVNPGFWAFQEIEALAASGITTGFPDGTYRPTEPVTRAQMATFLARALGLHWAP
jgi:hypothetical protein